MAITAICSRIMSHFQNCHYSKFSLSTIRSLVINDSIFIITINIKVLLKRINEAACEGFIKLTEDSSTKQSDFCVSNAINGNTTNMAELDRSLGVMHVSEDNIIHDDTGENVEEPLRARPMTEQQKTFKQKFTSAISHITVEPVAFLMLSASILAAVATQNLALEKTCRVNLNLGDAICDSLKNQDSNSTSEYERQVQQYVAYFINWKSVITSLLPGFLLAFVGGWMDKTGRRTILMMLPVLGEILQNLSNILNVVFFNQLSVQYLIFLDAFFGSFAGGWSVMFLAVFSYIADITTEKNRTHRLGLVSFCTYVGMPIGLALSGIILKNFGYYAIYGTAMSMHILNLLYILFVLHDPARTKEQLLVRFLYMFIIIITSINIVAKYRVTNGIVQDPATIRPSLFYKT